MRNRHAFRLAHWDYRENGAYFVTICTHRRRAVFGEIRGHVMGLNRFGCVVWNEWELLGQRRAEVILDEMIVMPNHIHLILFIEREGGKPDIDFETTNRLMSGSLGAIIRGFKSGVSREIGRMRGQKTEVWQGRYWERVVRDERELDLMRQYIR
ncbi:MAG: transposase, partial [Armatimonadetes bacterium]|nr:transposase [Armatimonadota bacterium]